MQIEAGKYYRTRDGRKAFVFCIATNPFGRCDHYQAKGYLDEAGGVHASWCHVNGKWTSNDSLYDLIAPWVDPPKKVPLEATVYADGRVEVDCAPVKLGPGGKIEFKNACEGGSAVVFPCCVPDLCCDFNSK